MYELQLENWSESPHFAKAYYDETEKALFRFSFTKAGFAQLNKILGQQGVVLDLEPHVKVTPSMLATAGNVLRREIDVNPYEQLFTDTSEESSEELNNLNHFLNLAMPFINNDEPFDIEKLATEAGVEIETAKDLLGKVQERLRKLWDDG